ncbi:gamma-glutamyltransferase, partial [Escherichia coli]|uniref:Gamma-glutamyltranspeptidase n=2 Tax=Escherichia coli TaxID=562 RepID=A0AAQ2DNH8_ECOLX|nr:gamma-glutamyltranspeptidase [Escherichia coli]EEG9063103.1 gamma-glutamyltranspeptidase [Escherichia coli]EEQ3605130.1 gamma-glutamyltranspeptidase [Escherichia coli]EES7284581.1 gamma-glutamyltranspeptidase [Escherichia coli]EFC6464815.1 gamma-glutamyltranspeptidase [Escherichia coli]
MTVWPLCTHFVTGSWIITTVLQMVVNSINCGMNVAEATNAPRFHYQWLPDELRVEKGLVRIRSSCWMQKGQTLLQSC